MSETIFETTGTGQIGTLRAGSQAMATISANGDVSINWKRVSEAAAGNGFRENIAWAQLMLAIRDGTYKETEI